LGGKKNRRGAGKKKEKINKNKKKSQIKRTLGKRGKLPLPRMQKKQRKVKRKQEGIKKRCSRKG